MKLLSELFPRFKSDTEAALGEHKAALATANDQIAKLSAKLEALEAANKLKADEDTAEDSEEESLLDALTELVKKFTPADSDSDDSTEDTSDTDDSDDSTEDDSDDENDESAKKATKKEKLKAISKSVSKLAAQNKALKASVPKQVIRELAAVGIPTPIATKVDGTKPQLTGRERIAAAFTEQLNNNK